MLADVLIVLWRGAAAALRTTATALEDFADFLDPDKALSDDARIRNATGDAHAPGAGTRERIADTLQRARSRYDAVTLAPRPGRTPR